MRALRERRFDPGDPELMDLPGELDETWRRDLANLRALNRFFGAHRIIRWFLRGRLERGRRLRILDLATGSGDLPRLAVDLARRAGCRLEVTAVDCHPATLGAAREWCAGYPEIRFVAADVRTWEPEDPGSFDLVTCSLALHHFTEEDARQLLRRARRLAGEAVLVADLERSWLAFAGVWFITATVFRDPMTVIDARKSVRAAFSADEFRGLARAAGWTDGRHRRFAWGRQVMVVEGDGMSATVRRATAE